VPNSTANGDEWGKELAGRKLWGGRKETSQQKAKELRWLKVLSAEGGSQLGGSKTFADTTVG